MTRWFSLTGPLMALTVTVAWAQDETASTAPGASVEPILRQELDKDTADAMTGALKYKDMTVSQVMTPLQNTFMLSVDEKLSFGEFLMFLKFDGVAERLYSQFCQRAETIATIFKTGYSRIPVYEV